MTLKIKNIIKKRLWRKIGVRDCREIMDRNAFIYRNTLLLDIYSRITEQRSIYLHIPENL